MTLLETINEDIKKALVNKEENRLSALRMLKAAIQNKEIEKRGKGEKFSEENEVAVLRSEVKKRKDAVVEFVKGGRQDLAEKEKEEIGFLAGYMPAEISDEEIKEAVETAVKNIQAAGPKDLGKVMSETMKTLKGKASGERISAAAKKILGL